MQIIGFDVAKVILDERVRLSVSSKTFAPGADLVSVDR